MNMRTGWWNGQPIRSLTDQHLRNAAVYCLRHDKPRKAIELSEELLRRQQQGKALCPVCCEYHEEIPFDEIPY